MAIRSLWEEIIEADRYTGVRLEMVAGVPVWEAHPALLHQRKIDRIRESIKPPIEAGNPCGCFHYADLYIRFPDGSLKRPDIAIFCQEPVEQRTAVTLLPEAVIEIISEGYEAKDLQIGVPFYLSQGIKDILVFDPEDSSIRHFRRDGERRYASPQTFTLECGCRCTL